jgi:DNA-directed RNA polymerase specialized sigma24 family protein
MTKTDVPASVRSIVANYSRRAAWIEAMELQQEAALTMIEAARTWRPGWAPLADYQGAAVAKRLNRLLAEMESPVRPFVGKKHERVHAESCDLEAADGEAQPGCAAEFHIDVRAAVREVFRIIVAPAARAVLLEERSPSAVATDLGLPVAAVYMQTKAARRALRSSAKLRALMEDLT